MNRYLDAVKKAGQDLHSIMIVQHGNVIAEEWMGEGKEDKPHILNSVSKTFTATAVGLAASEGRLKLTDKVISFFPQASGNRQRKPGSHDRTRPADHELRARHRPYRNGTQKGGRRLGAGVPCLPRGAQARYLLHLQQPGNLHALSHRTESDGRESGGLSLSPSVPPAWHHQCPVAGKPARHQYRRLGIVPQNGRPCQMGQLFLQKGNWNGKQILPEEWVKEASACQVPSLPAGMKPEMLKKAKMSAKTSDWLQGYGYQMWRCRHNAYRADGANGQYILVLPDKDAVIAVTANIPDMQAELNLIWKYLLPAL